MGWNIHVKCNNSLIRFSKFITKKFLLTARNTLKGSQWYLLIRERFKTGLIRIFNFFISGIHYRGVNEKVWSYFEHIYGGDPKNCDFIK